MAVFPVARVPSPGTPRKTPSPQPSPQLRRRSAPPSPASLKWRKPHMPRSASPRLLATPVSTPRSSSDLSWDDEGWIMSPFNTNTPHGAFSDEDSVEGNGKGKSDFGDSIGKGSESKGTRNHKFVGAKGVDEEGHAEDHNKKPSIKVETQLFVSSPKPRYVNHPRRRRDNPNKIVMRQKSAEKAQRSMG